MPVFTAQDIRTLEQLLKKECALYDRYSTLIKKERGILKSRDHEQVTKLSEERRVLQEAMLTAQDKRLALLRSCNLMSEDDPQASTPTLRSLVAEHCSATEQRILLPLAEDLRERVLEARELSKRHSMIVSFALTMVHALKSILRSGEGSVHRSYGRKGKVKESFSADTEASRVLKEA